MLTSLSDPQSLRAIWLPAIGHFLQSSEVIIHFTWS